MILPGCSTGAAAPTTVSAPAVVNVPSAHGGELSIYASVNLDGDDAQPSVADAMQLALEQAGGRAGGKQVRLVVLDETNSAGAQNPDAVAAGARAAARDSSTIAYLGDQTSGDTAIALPILNRAGILMVSPTATYGGLTQTSPDRTEPAKYYPTGRRTFARVVPDDGAQAAAQLSLERAKGCTHVYVLDDGSLYGRGLAADFIGDAKSAGLTIAGTRAISTSGTQFTGVSQTVAAASDCVLFVGEQTKGVTALWGALHDAGPDLKLFGTDSIATNTFAASLTAAQSSTFLTRPTLDESNYGDAGQAFYESYETRFGGPPDPGAIFGYEAMSSLLSAIQTAGSTDRTAVINAFFDTNNRVSPIGTYSIDANGDTTLDSYGSYSVQDGGLQFSGVLSTSAGA
jgi:branched-chain amino acid transport system substrate-binding protein